jgi:hypothetical protein
MTLQTEFEFTLPRGYIDPDGNLHRHGIMRMATAMDEIAPLRHAQVQQNQAYLVIVLLSRVVTKLGDLSAIDTGVMENLFSADLAYLQTLYRRINEEGVTTVPVQCPECQAKFKVDLSSLGGE